MTLLNKTRFVVFALAVLVLSSCKKSYLDTYSTTAVPASDVLANVGNAYAALNGIHRILYAQYDNQPEAGEGAAMIIRDLMGEDMIYTQAGGRMDFAGFIQYISHRNVNSANMRFMYRMYYRIISNANVLINGVDGVPGASDRDKKTIKGQALVYRAWAHFQAVQLWGERFVAGSENTQLGVPLLLTNMLEGQPRATVAQVYSQINKDLDEAITLLPGYTRTGSAAKSNFNVNVAKGIKARVALTQQNWSIAAQNANEARQGFTLMTNAQYREGFNKIDNPEWMWGSKQITDHNTFFWSFFASMGANFNGSNTRTQPKAINANLYNMIPATDVRKDMWDLTGAGVPIPPGGARIPYQNKKFLAEGEASSIGDVPYMRAAEMFLIEAEALARSGQNTAAQDVLFTLVKNRDAAYVKSTKTGEDLITEIMFHRRIELWGEGFRFTDLKRLNQPLVRTGIPNHNPSISLVMDVPAGDKQFVWLFHQDEINTNPAIIQNPL